MENFYNKNQIYGFEEKILAAGNCDSFIPMSFTEIEEKLRVTYYLQGYEKITSQHIKNPYQLLRILEKAVLKVKKAENHFILHERYLINMDSIYVNEDMGEVKLQFVPVERQFVDGEEKGESFGEKISELLEEMRCSTEEIRGREYIEMLSLKMRRLHLSKQGIINYIGELKRDAYICGWE